jgi:AMMECR1 domain-containing protein
LEINRFTPYGVEIKKEVYKGKDLRGSIGLWLDISTVAHFADIEITKID